MFVFHVRRPAWLRLTIDKSSLGSQFFGLQLPLSRCTWRTFHRLLTHVYLEVGNYIKHLTFSYGCFSLVSLCLFPLAQSTEMGACGALGFIASRIYFLLSRHLRQGQPCHTVLFSPSDCLMIRSHDGRAGQRPCSLSAWISQCSEVGGEVAARLQTQHRMANVQMPAASPYWGCLHHLLVILENSSS